MTARLTQLIARYVAAGLTSLAGYLGAEGVQTGDLAMAVATAIVAVGGFAVDLFIHRKQAGGLMKPAKPAACLALCAVLLAGCGTTPTDRWAAARTSVTTAQDVTMALHETDVIDDDDVRAVGPWIVTARKAVNIAYADLPEGGQSFDEQLTKVQDLLALVRKRLQEAKADQEGEP